MYKKLEEVGSAYVLTINGVDDKTNFVGFNIEKDNLEKDFLHFVTDTVVILRKNGDLLQFEIDEYSYEEGSEYNSKFTDMENKILDQYSAVRNNFSNTEFKIILEYQKYKTINNFNIVW